MNFLPAWLTGRIEKLFSRGGAYAGAFAAHRHERPAMSAPAAAPTTPAIARPDYQLSDNLWADEGSVFLTGTQALVRLLRMQRARDAKAGVNTQGFVSGYRGSPLGMV